MEQRRAAELRRSAAIRVSAAVGVAAGLTALFVAIAWAPFDTRSDVVGYPAFNAFNPQNYLHAYYLVVGFFPVAALLLFLGLTRIGPAIGLPVPPPRGPLRPATAPQAQPALVPDPPLESFPADRQRLIRAARVGFVAALVGLEAGIVANSLLTAFLPAAAAYVLLVLGIARTLSRSPRNRRSFEEWLAAVNAVGATLTVAGLVAMSSITGVRVHSSGQTVHYHWLPAWLGLPVTAALVGVVVTALRRAAHAARALAIERAALVLVAAPVCLFALVAVIHSEAGGVYGDAPSADLFHSGEQLVGARLVADGWLPWRDVVLVHGLLSDAVGPIVGEAIFGDSRWGNVAGITMVLHPLYLVSVYLLCVYLFGRNWVFLLLTGVLAIGTSLGPEWTGFSGENFRLLLWPLVLLALAATLNRPTPARAVGLATLVVAQTIVTPEAAPAALAVALILVGYEWYWRRPGMRFGSAYRRSLWFAGTCAGLAGLFCVFLATQGALGDFFYVSTELVRGHVLKGGLPPSEFLPPFAQYYFVALAPPAALLICFAYAVAQLRLRRPLRTEDWVMGAAAIFLLFYYPKFLARTDVQHLYQPYSVAFPLLLFIAYRAVAAAERQIRARAEGGLALRFTAHPVSFAITAVVAALASYPLWDRVQDAPASYRAQVERGPRIARLGYQTGVDVSMYRDLDRVIDAYLAPRDKLVDFTNEPALFLYVLDRDPSTRWFSADLTLTAELQQDQIRLLRKARPKLVVFDSTKLIGLANWDGIPTMVRDYEISQWILDHYRPLLTTHRHTIYARRDLPPPSTTGLDPEQAPKTRGIEFQTQRCDWGKAPNFLSGPGAPPPDAHIVDLRVERQASNQLRIEPPAGSRWSDFRWLQLDAGSAGFVDADLVLHDRPASPGPQHEIAFETIDRSPHRYAVAVGSCAQWHGYRGPLYLQSDPAQDISTVRLIR